LCKIKNEANKIIIKIEFVFKLILNKFLIISNLLSLLISVIDDLSDDKDEDIPDSSSFVNAHNSPP
jgi:hypothetical protein